MRDVFIYDISEIIQYHIENNIDLNCCNDFGFTPLMMAAIGNNIEVVEKLLSVKDANGNRLVDIDAYNTHYETAVQLAYQEGAFDVLKLLIESGCDVSKVSFTGLWLQNPDLLLDEHVAKNSNVVSLLQSIQQENAQPQYHSDMPMFVEGLTPAEMREGAKLGVLAVQKEMIEMKKQKNCLRSQIEYRFEQMKGSTSFFGGGKGENGWPLLLSAIFIDNFDRREKSQTRKNNQSLNKNCHLSVLKTVIVGSSNSQ